MPGALPPLPPVVWFRAWFGGAVPFHAFFVEPQLESLSICGRLAIDAAADEPARKPPHWHHRCACCRKVLKPGV